MRGIFPHFIPAGFLCNLSLTTLRGHRSDLDYNSCMQINWKLKARSQHAVNSYTCSSNVYFNTYKSSDNVVAAYLSQHHRKSSPLKSRRVETWASVVPKCHKFNFHKVFLIFISIHWHKQSLQAFYWFLTQIYEVQFFVLQNEWIPMLSVYTPLRLHLFHATQ